MNTEPNADLSHEYMCLDGLKLRAVIAAVWESTGGEDRAPSKEEQHVRAVVLKALNDSEENA